MPQPLVRAQHPVQRLLALDPGARRTGVAVSDELGLFAHPRPALLAASHAELVEAVRHIVERESIDEVVVGLPLSMSGADSTQTSEVRALIALLRRALSVRVTAWDERLTSVQAGRNVRESSRRRTGVVDSAAAALVLQAVLDARRGRGEST
jgi:putative holliday junction resolvase